MKPSSAERTWRAFKLKLGSLRRNSGRTRATRPAARRAPPHAPRWSCTAAPPYRRPRISTRVRARAHAGAGGPPTTLPPAPINLSSTGARARGGVAASARLRPPCGAIPTAPCHAAETPAASPGQPRVRALRPPTTPPPWRRRAAARGARSVRRLDPLTQGAQPPGPAHAGRAAPPVRIAHRAAFIPARALAAVFFSFLLCLDLPESGAAGRDGTGAGTSIF